MLSAVVAAAVAAVGVAPHAGASLHVRLPEPVRLTLAASGDFLIHSPVFSRALANGGGARYDFAPMFQPVRPWIAGSDLALCHVETPLVPGPPAGYPSFRTPPELAAAIRSTGWDACSRARHQRPRSRSLAGELDRPGAPRLDRGVPPGGGLARSRVEAATKSASTFP